MKRRNFIQNSTLTAASLMSVNPLFSNNSLKPSHIYNLNYAPHLGMFKHHAGKDPIDELQFMVDQGFTAFEDNEMRNRPVAQQEAMAKVMTDRNLTMGVFVAHKIYWTEPNLASGKKALRDEFLADIITPKSGFPFL